ncbi:MAG: trigger factor [Anaerolineaceae bacterium]
MNIETFPRDDHQVKVVAELDTEMVEKYRHQAARKISQSTKIPGFRPGKAPYAVVLRMYGEEAIQEQAMDLMVDAIYPDIIDQAKIQPGGPGKLEEVVSKDPPKFAFIIPLAPEIALGDIHTIRQEYTPPSVSEKEVDEALKHIRMSYSTAEPVERAAKEGDVVYLKMTGTLVSPAEGEDPVVFKESPHQVVIGENPFTPDDYPYAGFAKEITGLNANESKKIHHTYPENALPEKVQGKEVEFAVEVTGVKELVLPELNDEFAKTMGEFENVGALKEAVKKQIEDQGREEYDQQYFTELVDKVSAISTIKYPPQMLEDECENVLHSIEHNLSHQNMDFDTYLKLIKQDREGMMEKEIRPVAKERIVRMLIIDEVSRAEKIKLDDEKFHEAFNQTFAEMQNSPEIKKMKKPTKELANSIAYEAASRTLNRQVMEHLKAIATGAASESTEGKKPAKKAAAGAKKSETVDAEKPAKKAAPRAKKTEAAEVEINVAEAAPRAKKPKSIKETPVE